MLPIASVSLFRRTHRTLLNFSGSSVASGATRSENARAASPPPCRGADGVHEELRAADHEDQTEGHLDERGGRRAIGAPFGEPVQHPSERDPQPERSDVGGFCFSIGGPLFGPPPASDSGAWKCRRT
jgi:hypothetical protein